jgi:hypothetical protein
MSKVVGAFLILFFLIVAILLFCIIFFTIALLIFSGREKKGKGPSFVSDGMRGRSGDDAGAGHLA